MKSLRCPDCRRALKFLGDGKYECRNESCAVIEVHANAHMKPPVITRVKRASNLVNKPGTPFRSGICPECGRMVERIGDIQIAVCTGGRKDKHPPVEVRLERGLYERDLKAKEKEIEA